MSGFCDPTQHPRTCFFSKGLSKMLDERQMKLASGRKTIAWMIDALSGKQQGVIHRANQEQDQQQHELSPEVAIIHAVLTKSFLPHQKGPVSDVIVSAVEVKVG